MEKDNDKSTHTQQSEKSHGLLNVLKLLFLIAVLVCARYVLDWLISGKRVP